MLSGKRILLGVTGSIAAYKAVNLLRDFQKAGSEVRVIMTPSATRFVGIDTFASLSRSEVAIEVFPQQSTNISDSWVRHIQWSEWADALVIAPCTANTLAKIAHGFSDNMLTSTVLAARCPVIICPAMDGGMFQAPATQHNLELVHEFGFHVLEPDAGYLASGLNDVGRLPESERILSFTDQILSPKNETEDQPLKKKKVVVTAGPTREFLDPVRFISNPSSGKMGFAMAEAARDMGASVTLLHGPVSIPFPENIQHTSFQSAEELFQLIKKNSDADVIIMAAAVADFAPKSFQSNKMKKGNETIKLAFEPTTDILEWLGKQKKEGQLLIGFAMETENLMENASAKLKRKNLDWIAANSINEEGSGFRVDTNHVILIGKKENTAISGTKKDVARKILRHIFNIKE